MTNARPQPLSAAELTRAYAAGALSPVEVAEATIAAVRADRFNAFAAHDMAGTRTAAQASAQRWRAGRPLGPLDGVPVSIKDNIHLAGLPTRFGSLATPADPSAFDSPAAARLREAGALLHAKTTLPDHAHKIFTDSPLTGVTRNPRDPERTPGGSSGGAAASVAAGVQPIAIGTDGGGSIRIPAAWTGLVGFKPSHGGVPHYPRGAFAPLSHVGPLARTVMDVALTLDVISRPDPRDWYAEPPSRPRFSERLERDVRGWRVAYSGRLGLDDVAVDPDVAAAVRAAADLFASMGCHVEEIDPPRVRECTETQGVHWVAFSALLAERLGAAAAARLDPSLLQLVGAGRALTSLAVTDAYVRRGELGAELNLFMTGHDVLLAPVMPFTAPTLSEIAGGAPARPLLTSWCNLCGLPAASVPCGQDRRGLPIGLQIVGRRYEDVRVLQAARAYERAVARP